MNTNSVTRGNVLLARVCLADDVMSKDRSNKL